MIEVFKTNVQEVGEAKTIVGELLKHFPSSRINFALDDCDKILRAEGNEICPKRIIELVMQQGFEAEVLN
jgi:hypothetical protein